jgi:uncharacterized protein YlbG (UPF0298 family)
MILQRTPLIIFFHIKEENRVLQQLEKLKINIVYVSKKLTYIMSYINKEDEKFIRRKLLDIKQVRGVIPSVLFDEDFNNIGISTTDTINTKVSENIL